MQGDEDLASSPTLCRLEGRANQETAVKMHEIFVEQFIASFKKEPFSFAQFPSVLPMLMLD
ncbi:MAG: hypothetical protein ACH346_08265 [Chthoniobacterales bacterium]